MLHGFIARLRRLYPASLLLSLFLLMPCQAASKARLKGAASEFILDDGAPSSLTLTASYVRSLEERLALLENYVLRARGEVVFDSPGSHSWTVPTRITSVSVVCVGGGGGGHWAGGTSATNPAGGGAGGGLGWRNDIAVTEGAVLTVFIGAGGKGGNPSSAGADSTFETSVVVGGGGGRGIQGDGGLGGTFVGAGGGNGGRGGWLGGDGLGGGGAGGYTGDGGRGANGPDPTTTDKIGTNGAGGGGGGGGTSEAAGTGAGGGVGLLGQTSNGIAATVLSNGGPGGGGSGGAVGEVTGNGGAYGGGGAGADFGAVVGRGNGGSGACRIIWPGDSRQFPSTLTGVGQ